MAESTIILGKYEVLEVIGDGAEGRVYKACCISDGVPGVAKGELVALKRLKSTGHDKESHLFRRQIEILRKLNHPNIVRYKDSFVWREKELEEDIYCLVMELLDGQTLKTLLLKSGGGLSWSETKSIFSQILQALQYAAKNGVIHRDLKPSNIHITAKGTPKLVDFGIARQDDGETTATSSAAGAKGTFDYMAPDFALMHGGFRGDEQSDIFSFGVLLYYTLTGRLPFPALGENADRGYYIRWLGQSPPTAEFKHPAFRVLSHARTCVAKCVDRDRQVRLRSFDEVLIDFAKIGNRQLKHGTETYEFQEWLGKGGFGEVFRARRLSDKREVAVKRLFSSAQSVRFVREAKILRGATHPNLTEYIDFVEVRMRGDEREYYLILEYLEGMPGASLRERIKNSESGLDATEALRLFGSYLDCLEHLHRNGIIHRDIKPGNLYAPANNPQRAKIFDLGIAHDEEGTRTHGQVPGTLDYMPPEFATQASGRGSAQSDIYSIGVTLYLSLTKKLPFPRLPEKEADAWVAFIKRSEAPLKCDFDHPVFNLHPELIPLLRRALAGDPRQRPESARAMRGEILGVLEGWEKRKACDEAVAAGRAALDGDDYAEAERLAEHALELIPRDPEARQLLSKAQDRRKQVFGEAMAAARAAFASGDFEAAEREAARALALIPADEAARKLLRDSQGARVKREAEAAAAADERPTAVTMVAAGLEPADEATAETRPGDLEELLEFEEAARDKQKELERAEREQADARRSLRDEEAGKAAGVQRGRKKARLVLMTAAAAGLILAAGLYFGWKVWNSSLETRAAEIAAQQRDQERRDREVAAKADLDAKYKEAIDAGQAAYERKAYAAAIVHADAALANRSGDAVALKIRGDAQARLDEIAAQAERDAKYGEAMDAGRKAYDGKAYDSAIAQADAALTIKFGDAAALKLKNDAEAQQGEVSAQAERDRKYKEAMDVGQAEYVRKAYGAAVDQADAALANRPRDAAALDLKGNAQARMSEMAAQAERERRYAEAFAAGQKAFGRKAYRTAVVQAEAALAARPGDAAAVALGSDAKARLGELMVQAERDRKYEVAMDAGQKAYDGRSYDSALEQADAALASRSGDAAATKLRNDAQARKEEVAAQAERDRKFKEAQGDGQAIYDRKLNGSAIEQAKAAIEQAKAVLASKSADPAAAGQTEEALKQIEKENAIERNYQAAMRAGRTAFSARNYAEAKARADAALLIRPGNPEAASLKGDAQEQLDLQTPP
jgi:serine/threonine protein kinase